MANSHASFGGKAFKRTRRAVVAQRDRIRAEHLLQCVEHERHQPVDAGGIGLHDEHRAEPVDDEAREPVRLGMDKPVIGRAVDPLAQTQSSFEMPHKKPLSDRPRGVAVEEPRRQERMRVEHRNAERALVAAPQCDERAG